MRRLWGELNQHAHFIAYAILGGTLAAELAVETVLPVGHHFVFGKHDALVEDLDRVLAVAERLEAAHLPEVLVTHERDVQHTDHVLLLPSSLTKRELSAQQRALSRLKTTDRDGALSTPGLWHGALPYTEEEAQLLIGLLRCFHDICGNADMELCCVVCVCARTTEMELRHMKSHHNRLVAWPLLSLIATSVPLWMLRSRRFSSNFFVTLLPLVVCMAVDYATLEFAETDVMRQCVRADPSRAPVLRALLQTQMLYNRNISDGTLRSWFITASGNDLTRLPTLTRRLQLLDRV